MRDLVLYRAFLVGKTLFYSHGEVFTFSFIMMINVDTLWGGCVVNSQLRKINKKSDIVLPMAFLITTLVNIRYDEQRLYLHEWWV